MADLTTIANVKAFLGITDSSQDTLLTRLVTAVSGRIEAWCGRVFGSVTYTDEWVDSSGFERVTLSQYPLVSVTTVTESGTVLTGSDYAAESASGQLVRLSNGAVSAWAAGTRAVKVTYVAGYASLPPDVSDAAIQQTSYEWRKSKGGGDRLGLESQVLGPGTAAYITDAWAPGVEAMLRPWRRLP